MTKTIATIGDVPLAAEQPIVWQLTTGAQPFSTTMQVHVSDWPKLQELFGKPTTLHVEDARGTKFTAQNVTILHRIPTDEAFRVSFVVSDLRWKWNRTLVCRDYNVTKKTGDRDVVGNVKPIETQVVVDEYDYKPYSLNNGRRWTARDALLDALEQVVGDDADVDVESFPIEDEADGQASLQNLLIRDPGDVAIQRLLGYIPGSDIYVGLDGVVHVYDAASVTDAERYAANLPPFMRGGDIIEKVERKAIRPSKVIAYYPREVEIMLEYEDDYGSQTSANPVRNSPYIENVAQTVDPSTTVYGYDPESDTNVILREVPPGTWVPIKDLLYSWNQDRPADSLPWTFDTIKYYWMTGSLDALLGAQGADLDSTVNIQARIHSLKTNFRQTFRISRRYMERIRDIRAVRVGLLDPVSGARAPAAVWGQIAVLPSLKGYYAIHRKEQEQRDKWMRNINYLAPYQRGERLVETSPGPAVVQIVDKELGIFRLQWLPSVYGFTGQVVPCMMEHDSGNSTASFAPGYDLYNQDDEPLLEAARVEEGTDSIALSDKLEMRVLLTIVPAAPNNKTQFHRVEIEADEISETFRDAFGLEAGDGPPIELFVPPGDVTARFAWQDDLPARRTVSKLLGLEEPDPSLAGIPSEEAADGLPGYVLINEAREIDSHSKSIAAEALIDHIDTVQGHAATILMDDVKLAGNVGAVSVSVGVAPDANVTMRHVLDGRPRRLPAFALLSDSARQQILGVLPYRD